jgi:glycerophosphoryl diester phosphodiesterase
MKFKKCMLAGLIVFALSQVNVIQPVSAGSVYTHSTSYSKSFQQIHANLLDHSKNAPLMITAHRGQWRDYPENSLSAINEAIKDGADIVEIDVQLTSDNVPVLMHDETVDRTTNGTGKVSDFTLAEIQNLQLKEGLGGKTAALTEHRIPTLEEAMYIAKNRAIVNLDKGWKIREDIYKVLVQTGTVDHGLFKNSPTVEEAAEFMEKDPEILYMHNIKEKNADTVGTFPGRQPVAYEVVFGKLTDPQISPEKVRQIQQHSRIFVNVMWSGLAAAYTDEASLIDENLGWKAVTELGANILQTDNVEAMYYWRAGGNLKDWESQMGNRTVRVQAEDYLPGGQGVGYYDTDSNRCDTTAIDLIDVCNIEGATAVRYNMTDEWAKYEVNISESGVYQIAGRVSADATPAGTIMFDWNGQSGKPISLKNTTHKRAFELQEWELRYLEKGKHTFVIHVTSPGSYNLDYIQFDLQ